MQNQNKVTLNMKIQSKTKITLVSALLLASLLFYGCENEEPERPERPSQVEILPQVIFSVTDDQPLHRVLNVRGIVEPVKELPIIPRVAGFLTSHNIQDGKRVRTGDVLFQFETEEWQIGLREAEIAYARALQEFELESRQRLRTVSDIDTLTAFDERLLRNQTGYTQARTGLDRARLELTYTSMKAPFEGVVFTDRILTQGTFVSGGQELGKLIDYSTIRIRFDLLESELARVRTGFDVEITSADGYNVNGRVVAISPIVDRDRKTGQIIVEAANSNLRIKPGMSVDGRVLIETVEGRARAPREALLHRDNRPLVFKLNGDQVEWIYVDPVAVTSEWIILNEDEISPGDTLAVDNHFAISHLARVRPRIR